MDASGNDAQELRDSATARALDGLCVGLVRVGPAGRIRWMNRAAQRLLGLDVEDVEGRQLANVLRDPQMAAFWQEALTTEKTTMAEVTLHWPRRAEIKANCTAAYDTAGKLLGRVLIVCDVTAERQIQLRLSQEATERLLGIAEQWNESAEAKAGLTAQELRILRMVGQGFSNPQIADAMDIAVSTVRSHLKHIYGKLGLTTRSEAISYALRNALG